MHSILYLLNFPISFKNLVILVLYFQQCIQEIQCLKHERITEYIEEAIRSQRINVIPCTQDLMKIIELLGLTSQELLKESIAVEENKILLISLTT